MAEVRLPPHELWLKHFGTDQSFIAAMYRGLRFRVDLHLENIQNDALEAQYADLVETIKADDEDSAAAEAELCRLMTEPCYALIRDIAPKRPLTMRTPTLQEFYFPPTHYFELSGETGVFVATEQSATEGKDNTGFFFAAAELPEFPSTPRIPASQIEIVADAGRPIEDYELDIPSLVRVRGSDVPAFFKPCFDVLPSTREIATLARISAAGLSKKINVQRFRGIATSDDGVLVIGLILDLIPTNGLTLSSEECLEATHNHARWEAQVTHIVKELHAHDIVWGNAQPGNVLLDKDDNCWVVDFEGGHLQRFVDSGRAGTKEGDLEAIKRIFGEWLADSTKHVQNKTHEITQTITAK